LSLGPLSKVTGPEVCGGGDRVAGVLGRFHGVLPAIGLYAMEPEEALALLRAAFADCEPLAAYVALGGAVLEAAAAGLSACCGSPSPAGAGKPGGQPGHEVRREVRREGGCTLEEDSVIGTLLRTHAPSDTTVVALGLDVEAGEARMRADVYLLVEPKRFAGTMASVAHP